MLKLGHISYSNCYPVHGRLLEQGPPPSLLLVHGVPGRLNGLLERGAIDVAPASSIEYARHADRYRILPGLSISATGAVQTIQLLARPPIDELTDGARVAVPTASATSVALLKIVMTQLLGIRPNYMWFDQESQDPFGAGAAAALFIGDIAHQQRGRAGFQANDLGAIWHEWTGLPFVFALWQTGVGSDREAELSALTAELHASRDWSMERLPELAERVASDFGWSSDELLAYWRSIEYGWDEDLAAGLDEFYRRAAEAGALERAPTPSFVEA
jgi:chorismate dehydratase